MFAFFLLFSVTLAASEPAPAEPLTLEALLGWKEIQPQSFGRLFRRFAHRFSVPIQPAEKFLADHAGDCDDYAVLADFVFRHAGQRTRLVHVNLAASNVGHAVCYLDDIRGYLDYNNRIYPINVERCDPSIRAIASKVAGRLGQNWTTAAEFTYSYELRRKIVRYVVVKTDSPEKDPDRNRPPPPAAATVSGPPPSPPAPARPRPASKPRSRSSSGRRPVRGRPRAWLGRRS